MSVRFRPPAPFFSITYVYSPDPSYPWFSPDCDKIVIKSDFCRLNSSSAAIPLLKLSEQKRRKRSISTIRQTRGSHLFKMSIDGVVHSSLIHFFHGSTGGETTFLLPGINRHMLNSSKAWCIFVIAAGSMGYLLSVVLGLNESIAYPISSRRNNSLVNSSVRTFQRIEAVESPWLIKRPHQLLCNPFSLPCP